VASLSQGRTAAAQCGLFTHKSVPVIFEPPCICKIYYCPVFILKELYFGSLFVRCNFWIRVGVRFSVPPLPT